MEYILGTFAIDTLTGTATANILAGYEANDLIGGNGGNDTIGGGDGIDGLYGGSGSDTIYGGSGNDYINGYAYESGVIEIDNLIGEGGSDTFVLGDSTESYYIGGYDPITNTDTSYAVIYDFSWLEGDKIQVNADYVSAANLYYGGSAFGDPNVPDTGIYIGYELVSIAVDASVVSSDLLLM